MRSEENGQWRLFPAGACGRFLVSALYLRGGEMKLMKMFQHLVFYLHTLVSGWTNVYQGCTESV